MNSKNRRKMGKSIQTESSGSDSEEEVPGDHVTSSTEDTQPPHYEHIEENIYLFDKKKRVNKEVRKMQCDCSYDADKPDLAGCGEDCLNRLLMIECNHRCPCKDFCTNRSFQQGCKTKVGVLKTDKKGWGLATFEDLGPNQFVMEYCGEVMNYRDFQDRAERYDQENRTHYYFMTLKADEIIDATRKGNLSRFINHSCDPNCVTQKWTVNGLLRIGFFTLHSIDAGSELTFDYQLQRYGKVAQPCYCESINCRGIIGGEKLTPLKNTVERIATPPTCSPRRRKKRNIVNEFNDESLEDELERLVSDHRCLTNSDQALKLSRLMVRAETLDQRIMMLKILQNTTDQSCLKGFIRYQGLSLLWSWMVDGGVKLSVTLKKELLSTLKYLPIATKNQLEDSKVSRVLKKWSTPMPQIMEGEVGSGSSEADSHGNSPTEVDCMQVHDSSKDTKKSETFKEKDSKGVVLEQQYCGGKEQSDDEALDAEVAKFSSSRGEETKRAAESSSKSPEEMSEDDGKSEDDPSSLSSSEDDDEVSVMAQELLRLWSNLKEVYRIPKKSATPVKKEKELVTTTVPSPGRSVGFSEFSSSSICSPGKFDQLFKSLGCSLGEDNSPKPAFASDSEVSCTPKDDPICAETTVVEEEPVTPLQGSISESKRVDNDFTPSEVDPPSTSDCDTHSIPTIDNSNPGLSSKQTFGYQQKMGPRIERFGNSPYKSGRKSRRRRSINQRLQEFAWQPQQNEQTFQQNANMQGCAGHPDYGIYNNMNMQQQGSDWSSFQETPQYFQGNNFYNKTGQQAPSLGNFAAPSFHPSAMPLPPQIPPPNVSLPNIPPHEFFRKVPPPNFPVPQSQQAPAPLLPQVPNYPPPHILPNANYPAPLQQASQTFSPPSSQPAYPQYLPPPAFQPTNQLPQYPNVPTMPSQSMIPQVFTTQHRQIPPFTSPPPCQTGIPQTREVSPPSVALPTGSQASEATVQDCGSTNISSSGTDLKTSEQEAMLKELQAYSPVKVKPKASPLPANWRTAMDPQGKVYYYHALTRQTQWERPKFEPESNLILESDDIKVGVSKNKEDPGIDHEDIKKEKKQPCTPPGTPPASPTLAYTTAPADTTEHRRGAYTPPGVQLPNQSHRHQLSAKESFRMKLSNVVVNCLNPYFKVTCQQGRVTNPDDFKYLARKLTHGVMMKEMSHLKREKDLQCNDSVKIKTKEFIRSYMSKFGPMYKRV